jgi:alpha,alpha-trehalose phosphorylase
MSDSPSAVLFDLDGVLVDTAELHFRSWAAVAAELRIPFDRQRNEALRGLGRMESLDCLLGEQRDSFSAERRQAIADAKNDAYLAQVARLTPADLLPGVPALLAGLRQRGVAMAVASSSKNARAVLERLQIAPYFAALIDGNDAPRSKPDPQVFLVAAGRLGVRPAGCLVVEDAASGVAAARAAGMRVLGVGPPERIGDADFMTPSLADMTAERLLAMLPRDG